ncbi:unnamed protein product, partial [Urochloa humidicola]
TNPMLPTSLPPNPSPHRRCVHHGASSPTRPRAPAHGTPCGGRGQGEGILRSAAPTSPFVSDSTSRPIASLPSSRCLLPVAHPRCVPDVPRCLCPRALSGLVGGHLHVDESSSRDALLASPTLHSITTRTPLRSLEPGHGGLAGARSSHDEPRSGRIILGSEMWLRLITKAWVFKFLYFSFCKSISRSGARLRVWTTRGLLGCGLTLDPLFKLPFSRP